MSGYPSADDKRREPTRDDLAELHDMLNQLAETMFSLDGAGTGWLRAAIASWPERGDAEILASQLRILADTLDAPAGLCGRTMPQMICGREPEHPWGHGEWVRPA